MKFITATAVLSFCIMTTISAQNYNYLIESFEESVWSKAGSSVNSSTGLWTTNKNIQSTEQAHEGSYSLKLSNKTGIISPYLSEGVGSIIYYAHDTNREANIEVSEDKNTWTLVENYKSKTGTWEKHVVAIDDAKVRYVRFSTTSNSQYYLDDIIITKPDGTTGDGEQLSTDLILPYFIQDFEQTDQYPSSKEEAATEKSFIVSGQGEWIYKDAYRATNASYITDGSAHDLRLLKNTSYVITPILTQGVVRLSFNEGRRERVLSIYVSKDEGKTWTKFKEVTTDTDNQIIIEEKDINRIKIANDTGKGDVDVDNLCVTAYPEGTPPTVITGEVQQVTSSSAQVTGSITETGDKDLREYGVCWSIDDTPTLKDHCVTSVQKDEFVVTMDGLPAKSTIYYRAYALSLAGVGYGEIKYFETNPPTTADVHTGEVTIDTLRTDETHVYVHVGGDIINDGGVQPTEVGVCYSENENPTLDNFSVKSLYPTSPFVVNIALAPKKIYYFRAYVINEVGVSYGEQVSFNTPEIIIPEYSHRLFYVSPGGNDANADGSFEHPYYNVQRAINLAQAGDTIFMNSGTYKYDARIDVKAIGKKNSGMVVLMARNGRALLDFSSMAVEDGNQGMRITGSYWHIYGLDIFGAGDNGMLIERNKPSGGGYAEVKDSIQQGHDNIIENCRFYRNRDTGLQMKNLAAYNKVINCDSYFNADPDHGDADGFAVKISHGDGNYFYGCRAWNNSDDGWDGFIKTDGGFPDDITTTFESCWAFNNGYLEDGTLGNGNGNGFKLGSDYGRNNVVLNRCLAFENYNKGFDQNHNTGHMIFNNCTGYSSKNTDSKSRYTYRLDEAVASGHEIRLTNCVAISDGVSDRNKSEYAVYSVIGKMESCDMNTLPADYKSISTLGTDAERQADGSLPQLDFMHIADGNTQLIDKGIPVYKYPGESHASVGIEYEGAAPDLGCFETPAAPSSVGVIEEMKNDNRVSLHQLINRQVTVTISHADVTDMYRLSLYDMEGHLLKSHTFMGGNTLFSLPHNRGVLMIIVEGNNWSESIKIVVR